MAIAAPEQFVVDRHQLWCLWLLSILVLLLDELLLQGGFARTGGRRPLDVFLDSIAAGSRNGRGWAQHGFYLPRA